MLKQPGDVTLKDKFQIQRKDALKKVDLTEWQDAFKALADVAIEESGKTSITAYAVAHRVIHGRWKKKNPDSGGLTSVNWSSYHKDVELVAFKHWLRTEGFVLTMPDVIQSSFDNYIIGWG